MRVEFKNIGGINTRVLRAGKETSRPVLLIHGFGLSADSWIKNIEPLSEHFFVIAPDLIGHGFTDAFPLHDQPPHQFYLEHLDAVSKAYGFDRFCPIGSSFGALLAALLHLRHIRRVEKLVIAGSASCFNDDQELAIAGQKTYENQAAMMSNPSLDSCRTRMYRTVYDPSSVPEALLHLQLTSYARPGAFDAWKEGMNGMMKIEEARPFRIYDRLESVGADTLIVWGREDPRGVYARAQEAARRIPRARLVTFEKCGHFPALEHPTPFNQEIIRFLTT